VEDSTKLDAAAELVTETLAGEDRVVIFTEYRLEGEYLAAKLNKAGWTVLRINGDTKQDARLKIRQRFADRAGHPEKTVLVAATRTMSTAVNELVVASHAVYTTLPRREDWIQSVARLDRNGQTRPVTIWAIMARNTVDKVIWRSHIDGTKLDEALFDYIKRSQG